MQPLSIINGLLQQFDTPNRNIVAAVVGGGNSAHILVNILPRNGIETIVITRRPNEWNTDGITMTLDNKQYIGRKFRVSDDYKHISMADVVFLCCPVSAQLEILSKMKAFVKPTALIGTLFGAARFDKMVEYIMGDKQPCFAFVQIPFICRATKYGKSVDNLGDQSCDLSFREKDKLLLSQLDMSWLNYIHTNKSSAVEIQQTTFVREWFFPGNNIIHPGICYGRYLVGSKNAYFYRHLSAMSGAAIDELDVERLKVVNALNNKYNLDINNISIVKEWNDVWNCKGENMCQCIANEPSLQSIIAGKDVHMNAKHRFFQDDIPFGLCYIKHFAEILKVETLFLDRVIRWAQSVMNVQYLNENGQLIRENLPQYYANQS